MQKWLKYCMGHAYTKKRLLKKIRNTNLTKYDLLYIWTGSLELPYWEQIEGGQWQKLGDYLLQ